MSPQSMQLIYRRSGHHYNDWRHRIMPPPQQQRYYLINNHIIHQSNNYKNSTLRLRTMIRPPTIITTTSPLQINCSDGHHQHDQPKHRKTPLLQQYHHYCFITLVQQSNNVRFSARRITPPMETMLSYSTITNATYHH